MMNTNADPCEDFYEFTCGGFLNSTKIPEGEMRWSRFKDAIEAMKVRERDLLEDAEVDSFDTPEMKTLVTVKNFY